MTELSISDITEEWVKMNYNINKERKTIDKTAIQYCVAWDLDDIVPVNTWISIEQYHKTIDNLVEKFKRDHASILEKLDDYVILINIEQDRYEDIFMVYMKAMYKEVETDQEVIRRLQSNAISRLRRINNNKQKEYEQREKELKLYRELRKKYKGVV